VRTPARDANGVTPTPGGTGPTSMGRRAHAAPVPLTCEENTMRQHLRGTHILGAGVVLLLALFAAPRHAWAQG
jgi:hypothetical protein